MQFNDSQKKELLAHARQTLIDSVSGAKKIEEEIEDDDVDPTYLEKAGVFISLHKDGELRGCVGYIDAVESIWDAIKINTTLAAKDYRFKPVAPEEIALIDIEISILSSPKECEKEEITEGQDGVVISNGAKRATFLPQVWQEIQDKTEFFTALCAKAKLDLSCLDSSKTKFYKYQAIVFGEKQYEG